MVRPLLWHSVTAAGFYKSCTQERARYAAATPPVLTAHTCTLCMDAAVKARLMKEWDPEYEPEDIRPPQDTPDVHSERATNVTLDMILHDDDKLARKTKIICTAGPACWSEDGMAALLEAGCNVLRLNFSHGDHKGHGEVLQRFRQVRCAAVLRTPGPTRLLRCPRACGACARAHGGGGAHRMHETAQPQRRH